MNRPLLVGLTGGIGSGKSTVAKIFEVLGVPVYYADDRGKWLLAHNDSLKAQVMETFGSESYFEDGSLNRVFLANEVFPDPDKLEKLNQMVHPEVAKDFNNWIALNNTQSFLIKEAALLFETESYKSLDHVICVMAPKSVRLQRVLLRDMERPEAQVLQIMGKQVADSERKKLADYIINNSGEESIIDQVLSLHQKLESASN